MTKNYSFASEVSSAIHNANEFDHRYELVDGQTILVPDFVASQLNQPKASPTQVDELNVALDTDAEEKNQELATLMGKAETIEPPRDFRNKIISGMNSFLSDKIGLDDDTAFTISEILLNANQKGFGLLDITGLAAPLTINEGVINFRGGKESDDAFTQYFGGLEAVLGFLEGIPLVGGAMKIAGKEITPKVKEGISLLADKVRKAQAGEEEGVKLFSGFDPTEIVNKGIVKLDDMVGRGSNTGYSPDRLNIEDDVKEVLKLRAEQMDLKPKDRVVPSLDNPLFDTSPQSYENLMVEQIEVPVPRNTVSEVMPLRNRTNKVVEMSDQIAEILAERIVPLKGSNVQYFYHTSPLIKKAVELGIPEETAKAQLKKFALNYAATSPRTTTDQNLRNAALVASKEKLNVDLTEVMGPGGDGINEKGYPMMIGPSGIHKKLIDDKRADALNINTNPKPITFAENVAGNLEGVTVDTHAIRAVFDVMNELEPGSVPIDFIGGKNAKKTKEFQALYKKDPSKLDVSTMINDTLASQMIDGQSMQTEYAVFSDLYKKVAEKAGVKPAEAQSLSWFANGDKTGLASEPKTIVDLIEDRIDVTANLTNQPKEEIFKKFMEGSIPLLSIPAGITLLETGASMEGLDE